MTLPDIVTVRTIDGPVLRKVRPLPSRPCLIDEVPILDFTDAESLDGRIQLAAAIKDICLHKNGIFYIKNHPIPLESIKTAVEQSHRFFGQSTELKSRVHQRNSQFFNGWEPAQSTQWSQTESPDKLESFSIRYDHKYDRLYADVPVPVPLIYESRAEKFVWEGTRDLTGFEKAVQYLYSAYLDLSRLMLRIIARALGLEEHSLDDKVTFPCADLCLNWYPPCKIQTEADVGLGSHTDQQTFTLLWQDSCSGLQVLTRDGQWLEIPPIQDTLIVNTGEFLTRLTNGLWPSTVHRVLNPSKDPRISIPFFFGKSD